MMVVRSLESFEEAQRAHEIENSSLSTAWSASQINEIPDYAVYFGAFDGELLGVASMYALAGEGQIMNVAVDARFRRLGVANALMQKLIDAAIERKCEIITLEVEDGNFAAIALYEKFGFSVAGRRKGFYNGRDALIMEKKL